MSVRNSLLAMLATEPTHGYGLKSSFEQSTAGAWPLNVGQVYTTLSRLERDGLVVPHNTDDPDRHSWQITEAGEEALSEWYRSPVDERGTRDELVIKVLVAINSGESRIYEVLATQRDATLTRLQSYTQQRRELAGQDDLSATLLLDALILRADSEVKWLERCQQRLEQQPSSTSTRSQS